MIDEERGATETMDKDPKHQANDEAEVESGSARKKASRSRPLRNEEANIGTALRAVYQRTVEENIPQEMLDLLKRLD